MKIRKLFTKSKSRIAALSLLVIGGSIYATTRIVDKLFNFDDVTDIDQDDIDKMMGV